MGPPKATKANKYQAKCPPRHAACSGMPENHALLRRDHRTF